MSTAAFTAPQRELERLLSVQKAAHLATGPLSAETRIAWLDRLIGLMVDHQDDIVAALNEDFGNRSAVATLLADVFAVVGSLKYARENLRGWMQPEGFETQFPDAAARVEYQALGVVGILSPWNFPFNLIFAPLAGVVAAGNRAIIKPSEFTPASSELTRRMIAAAFDESEIAVVTGDAAVAAHFATLPFDHILFTGSTSVAKHVARAAAENLVPLTLELGGKSPVIVSGTAPVADAAARVMTVKTLNAGQICLAPDYVLLPEGKVPEFTAAAGAAVAAMFPTLKDNPDYTSIINQRHYDRLRAYLDDARAKGAAIVELNPAGEDFSQQEARRLPPTLVIDAPDDARIMQDEIFGPLLPIRTYRAIDEAIAYVNARPRPLALYYFGQDEAEERRVLDRTTSGGVTVNDAMSHAFAENLPFGGVGGSGTGAYHGKAGFLAFSHAKAVYRQSKAVEAEYFLRPPYGDAIRQFLAGAIAR
ncbi:coniferyl aldehyde dehydrogenase [Zavarzinia compransoris]|uniref:Aldehyde dehydrogenase n=1 Tax=Zavarzinia compransoris TaxID=1264899 RepID=A0A317E7B3_9PROT|nr:coniferyl aldehyde dehydrogenase [Zavarzinia compransoris]PWR20975.1 coniferyl aldehyde dehydrogenase [Zavarzinia compransoris]TDP44004.1 coniferyl-aldehyde dehydrogenase [Zavarzinia compransoris]